jgi:hypothetical protein
LYFVQKVVGVFIAFFVRRFIVTIQQIKDLVDG